MTTAPFIVQVLNAATRHGEDSDPDHEVGDLQMFARDLWRAMTPKQRTAFAGRETWREFIAAWSIQ